MSQRFLDHAQTELDKGNRLQASEKIWGAKSRALKAIAMKRGWRHRSNTTLFDIATQVGQEFDVDDEFSRNMSIADSMHKNFYENNRRPREIQVALEAAREFVGAFDRVRVEPERPFTVKDSEDRERLGNLLGLPRSQRPAIGTTDPRGFSGPPKNGDDSAGGARPAEPHPPDRPSSPVERPPIPDNVSIPTESPTRRNGPQVAKGAQTGNRTPHNLKSKSGYSARGPTPKRPNSEMPAEIKRFARKSKKR